MLQVYKNGELVGSSTNNAGRRKPIAPTFQLRTVVPPPSQPIVYPTVEWEGQTYQLIPQQPIPTTNVTVTLTPVNMDPTKCGCTTEKGNQCRLPRSMQPGYDSRYCWKHQGCGNPWPGTKPDTKCQCMATTMGHRCTRDVIPPEKYCYQHKDGQCKERWDGGRVGGNRDRTYPVPTFQLTLAQPPEQEPTFLAQPVPPPITLVPPPNPLGCAAAGQLANVKVQGSGQLTSDGALIYDVCIGNDCNNVLRKQTATDRERTIILMAKLAASVGVGPAVRADTECDNTDFVVMERIRGSTLSNMYGQWTQDMIAACMNLYRRLYLEVGVVQNLPDPNVFIRTMDGTRWYILHYLNAYMPMEAQKQDLSTCIRGVILFLRLCFLNPGSIFALDREEGRRQQQFQVVWNGVRNWLSSSFPQLASNSNYLLDSNAWVDLNGNTDWAAMQQFILLVNRYGGEVKREAQ